MTICYSFLKAKALFVLQPIITKFPVLPTQTAAHCRFFDYTILRNAFLYNCEDGKRRPLFLKLLFRVSLVLLFGRPGAAAAHYVRSVGANNHSPPTIAHVIPSCAAAPSGFPLKWPAGTVYGTRWSPPFKGVRGIPNPTTPPAITASIPGAHPFVTY